MSHDERLMKIGQRMPLSQSFRVYCCNWLCNSCCLRTTYRRQLERGSSRLGQELDIQTFIMRQKRQFFAFKAMYTKLERYLIENNKYFVLHGAYSQSDSESDQIQIPWDESMHWNRQNQRVLVDLLE